MKNVQQILKKRTGIIGMLCLLAVAVSSCTKDNQTTVNTVPAAAISVIDLSPDAGSLDFYLDANRANSYPITYGNGLDYLRAYTGKRTATFNTVGTQTKIKSDTMTLVADKYYSLFLSNLASKADYTLLKDTLVRPAANMASVRFINLSADAPAVDFAIKGGAVLAANKAYKTFTAFKPVAGNTAYTIEVRQAGTATVLASITNLNLKTGAVYTIWLQGVSAATDNTKLTANVQLNAYYY